MAFNLVKFVGLTIVGGVVVGGLTFNGAPVVDGTIDELHKLSDKVVQYESNEQSLLEKIGLIKSDATTQIQTLQTTITELQTQITQLEAEITALENGDVNNGQKIQKLKDELAALQAQYDALVTEKDLYKSEAERANKEVEKANEAVAKLDAELEASKTKTKDKEPLTKAELDAIGTSVNK